MRSCTIYAVDCGDLVRLRAQRIPGKPAIFMRLTPIDCGLSRPFSTCQARKLGRALIAMSDEIEKNGGCKDE